jgi:hypothetical protein
MKVAKKTPRPLITLRTVQNQRTSLADHLARPKPHTLNLESRDQILRTTGHTPPPTHRAFTTSYILGPRLSLEDQRSDRAELEPLTGNLRAVHSTHWAIR